MSLYCLDKTMFINNQWKHLKKMCHAKNFLKYSDVIILYFGVKKKKSLLNRDWHIILKIRTVYKVYLYIFTYIFTNLNIFLLARIFLWPYLLNNFVNIFYMLLPRVPCIYRMVLSLPYNKSMIKLWS